VELWDVSRTFGLKMEDEDASRTVMDWIFLPSKNSYEYSNDFY